jgi:hypothetical protein
LRMCQMAARLALSCLTAAAAAEPASASASAVETLTTTTDLLEALLGTNSLSERSRQEHADANEALRSVQELAAALLARRERLAWLVHDEQVEEALTLLRRRRQPGQGATPPRTSGQNGATPRVAKAGTTKELEPRRQPLPPPPPPPPPPLSRGGVDDEVLRGEGEQRRHAGEAGGGRGGKEEEEEGEDDEDAEQKEDAEDPAASQRRRLEQLWAVGTLVRCAVTTILASACRFACMCLSAAASRPPEGRSGSGLCVWRRHGRLREEGAARRAVEAGQQRWSARKTSFLEREGVVASLCCHDWEGGAKATLTYTAPDGRSSTQMQFPIAALERVDDIHAVGSVATPPPSPPPLRSDARRRAAAVVPAAEVAAAEAKEEAATTTSSATGPEPESSESPPKPEEKEEEQVVREPELQLSALGTLDVSGVTDTGGSAVYHQAPTPSSVVGAFAATATGAAAGALTARGCRCQPRSRSVRGAHVGCGGEDAAAGIKPWCEIVVEGCVDARIAALGWDLCTP